MTTVTGDFVISPGNDPGASYDQSDQSAGNNDATNQPWRYRPGEKDSALLKIFTAIPVVTDVLVLVPLFLNVFIALIPVGNAVEIFWQFPTILLVASLYFDHVHSLVMELTYPESERDFFQWLHEFSFATTMGGLVVGRMLTESSTSGFAGHADYIVWIFAILPLCGLRMRRKARPELPKNKARGVQLAIGLTVCFLFGMAFCIAVFTGNGQVESAIIAAIQLPVSLTSDNVLASLTGVDRSLLMASGKAGFALTLIDTAISKMDKVVLLAGVESLVEFDRLPHRICRKENGEDDEYSEGSVTSYTGNATQVDDMARALCSDAAFASSTICGGSDPKGWADLPANVQRAIQAWGQRGRGSGSDGVCQWDNTCWYDRTRLFSCDKCPDKSFMYISPEKLAEAKEMRDKQRPSWEGSSYDADWLFDVVEIEGKCMASNLNWLSGSQAALLTNALQLVFGTLMLKVAKWYFVDRDNDPKPAPSSPA
eukprot:392815-Rhodomonas_salina.1